MEGWIFDEFWTLNQDKVLRYFRFGWRRSATEHLQPMLQAENMEKIDLASFLVPICGIGH